MWRMMEVFVQQISGQTWGSGGPKLVTRVWKEFQDEVAATPNSEWALLPPSAYYPVAWDETHFLFENPFAAEDANSPNATVTRLGPEYEPFLAATMAKMRLIEEETIAVHLWHSLTKGQLSHTAPDSLLGLILQQVSPLSFARMLRRAQDREADLEPLAAHAVKKYRVRLAEPVVGQPRAA